MVVESHGRNHVAFPDGSKHALTVLTRLAQRRDDTRWLELAFAGRLEEMAEPALAVAVKIGDPLGQVLAPWMATEASPELAERVMERCAEDDYSLAVPLHEVAFEATRKCLEERKASRTNPDEDQVQEHAELALNLGKMLGDLGRHGEALEAASEAVEHYRELAPSRPDDVLPDLAMSLTNLGCHLSELGRREEALEATREAVD